MGKGKAKEKKKGKGKGKGTLSLYLSEEEHSDQDSSSEPEKKKGKEKKKKEEKKRRGKRRKGKTLGDSDSDSESPSGTLGIEDDKGEEKEGKNWLTKMTEGRAKFVAEEAKLMKKDDKERVKGKKNMKSHISANDAFAEGMLVDLNGLEKSNLEKGGVTLTLAETDIFIRDPVTGKLKLNKEEGVLEYVEASENRKAE